MSFIQIQILKYLKQFSCFINNKLFLHYKYLNFFRLCLWMGLMIQVMRQLVSDGNMELRVRWVEHPVSLLMEFQSMYVHQSHWHTIHHTICAALCYIQVCISKFYYFISGTNFIGIIQMDPASTLVQWQAIIDPLI